MHSHNGIFVNKDIMILERENESCSPDVSSGRGGGELVGFYDQSEYEKRAESPPVYL